MVHITTREEFRNEADILVSRNGVLTDLETGMEWNPDGAAANAEKKAALAKAKQSREGAKALGGKALKGSAKQKKWAEELRAKALKNLTTEMAARVLADARMQDAKFWIENRNRLTSSGFTAIFEEFELNQFQAPLRNLVNLLEQTLARAAARSGTIHADALNAIADANKIMGTKSRDEDKYSEIAERLVDQINAL